MIYDINTKNISFLEVSNILKTKGVANNKFMLLLYDESLVGVDPYDPNLSVENMAKIYCEITKNYWYFLREVCMVVASGSASGEHFQLNLGNCAASYCNINNMNSILILPRQIGKTVVEVAFSLWTSCFGTSFSKESYLHKNQDGSNGNLGRYKQMKSLFPKWLQSFISSPEDKDNITLKYVARTHNEIQALAGASNDVGAEKIGRGSSTALVYCDEFAFLERNEKIFNALTPAWYRSAMVAKENNAPYGIRITTTPNTLSLPQAAYCYKYITNACKFSFKFYDIPVDELAEYVKKNSGNDFVYIEYKWYELGKTKDWYDDQLRAMNNDILNATRELDCEWPESNLDNVFTEAQLKRIKNLLKPELFSLNIDGYDFHFYEKIQFELNYIISCDVASGSSQDNSVILIIHPEDFRVVGIFVNPRIDTDAFKNLIYDLCTKYLIHSVINIENNSYGKNILDSLMKNPNIESRLYREPLKRKAEKILDNGIAVKQTKTKLIYGTSTTESSRKEMFSLLMQIVDEEPEVFVSDLFYNEVRNLEIKKNKIQARLNFHDDIVMSYLITRYALVYGKCFQEKFHINKVPSSSNARLSESEMSKTLFNFGNMINNFNNYESSYDTVTEQIKDMNQKGLIQGYDSPDDYDSNSYFLDKFSSWNNDY